jgi:hypothetical protein
MKLLIFHILCVAAFGWLTVIWSKAGTINVTIKCFWFLMLLWSLGVVGLQLGWIIKVP